MFLFTTASRPALWPILPPIQWIAGALSLEVKRPGREADISLPSSAEVKNAWSYTSTLHYVFMAWCSVKAQEHHYLIFIPYMICQQLPCKKIERKEHERRCVI
jgi:hypothetical protein